MPARIAHISDTHLGAKPSDGVKQNVWGVEMRTRLLENDYYERFAELFDTISKMDPPVDLVIHSGDLYNSPWEGNPQQPPVVAQETAISILKDFIESTGIPVLIIEGNHGLYRSLEVSLLDSLKLAVPGLEVATQQDLKKALAMEQPLVKKFENLDVYCFPFLEKNVLVSSGLLEDFNDWVLTHQQPDSKRLSVAVAHGMDLDETLYSSMFSLPYDYFALGHDHRQHKHAKNAWYAGAPERWRFDEINHKKGFLIIDISDSHDTTVTEHHLDFVRPVISERISIELDDTVESILAKIEQIFENVGVKSKWDPTSAARIRLVLEGNSARFNNLDISLAMEALRMNVLGSDSAYNISQLKWSVKLPSIEHDAAAYPEIEADYLIENPESDFLEYLETVDLDERYDEKILTKIAVKAMKKTVTQDGEKLTLDSLMEDESG
ncbi:MAG: exonuclease SbcCD subunit D [Candidatus Thorarchaeota archaeon]